MVLMDAVKLCLPKPTLFGVVLLWSGVEIFIEVTGAPQALAVVVYLKAPDYNPVFVGGVALISTTLGTLKTTNTI